MGAYDSTREDGTVESVFPLDDEANQESEVLERDEEAIARVMNDLGCTLQQVCTQVATQGPRSLHPAFMTLHPFCVGNNKIIV